MSLGRIAEAFRLRGFPRVSGDEPYREPAAKEA